ncbi:MAG: hypothetical protein OJF50_003086 [Nitrospira sp.]|nr:hypothetical protein [Nitrospira sp.]
MIPDHESSDRTRSLCQRASPKRNCLGPSTIGIIHAYQSRIL